MANKVVAFWQQSRRIVLLNQMHITNSVAVRSIFTEIYLKIDTYKKDRDLHRKMNGPSKYEKLKEQLSVSENSPIRLTRSDVETLFYFSNDAQDFELAVKAFKSFLKNSLNYSILTPEAQNVEEKKKIGADGYEPLLYILSKTFYSLGLLEWPSKILTDEELRIIGRCSYPALAAMNMLLAADRYDDVLNVFKQQLPLYMSAEEAKKFKHRYELQEIPHNHLKLVTQAILLMSEKDGPKAVVKLRELLDILEKRKSTLVNTALVCAFIVAIDQNDLELAHRIVTQSNNKTTSVHLNLQIIDEAKRGNWEEAFEAFKQLIKIRQKHKDPESLEGRFFPETMKALGYAYEIHENKAVFEVKMRALNEAVIKKNAICQQTMRQYCFVIPPHIEVKQKERMAASI